MYIFNAPEWFIGYDIGLELAFAVVALIVSWHAFKVYKITGQSPTKIFGISFLFISISYFLQSFLNYSIVSNLNQSICLALQLNNLIFLNTIEFYVHMVLFLLGLITLTYMTLKIKSKKTYVLLVIAIFTSTFLSSSQHYSFYFISSTLLIYIAMHYLINYLRHRQAKTLLVLFAFILLLFGSIHYFFAVNHSLFYAISHILELIAYILILINLILVTRK